MKLQVLISTMNQTDYSLLERMNIQTDAVVVNQCSENKVEDFDFRGHRIKWISMSDRGIGLSRNTALFNSSSDIVLFADDDMVYENGYEKNVINAFKRHKAADIICFNIKLLNSNKNIGGHRNNTVSKKLSIFNSMRYGATLIAARRKSLLRERITFSLLFGGGAEFNSGEDSIFIKDCYDSGLQLYSDTYYLGSVDDSQSSWYKGIDDKFFIDRGMVYYTAFPKLYNVIFTYYAYKLCKLDKKYGAIKIFLLFNKGKKIIRNYR